MPLKPSAMLDVVLVGCGRAAELFHAPALRRLAGQFRVVGLVDPSLVRRERLASLLALDVRQCFEECVSFRSVRDPDVVVVATPTPVREEVLVPFARPGVTILVEKPLSHSVKSARRLADAATMAGASLRVIHNYLFEAHIIQLMGIVDSRALGDVERVGVTHEMRHPFQGTWENAPRWRERSDSAGAGCLLDLGYHGFYILRRLAGEIVRVTSACVEGQRGAEQAIRLCTTHVSGAEGTLHVSWRADDDRRTVTVEGRATASSTDGRDVEVNGRVYEVSSLESGPVAAYERIYRGLIDDGTTTASVEEAVRINELVEETFRVAFSGAVPA